ncbi:RnfABCDGE type electron transport complex subunit A [Treponema sp.]
MKNIFLLSIFSVLASNAVLSFGLGLSHLDQNIQKERGSKGIPALAMFLSGILSWSLVSYFLSFLNIRFLETLILFPLTVLICTGTDYLSSKLGLGSLRSQGRGSIASYNGLAFVAAYLAVHFAPGLFDAFVISLGSALGFYISALILDAIRKKSYIEKVPHFIRGTPLLLLSAGLLSLISVFVAALALLP